MIEFKFYNVVNINNLNINFSRFVYFLHNETDYQKNFSII